VVTQAILDADAAAAAAAADAGGPDDEALAGDSGTEA
jgi:hypothetical protein